MKLLVDANLSPRVATSLVDQGHEATLVGEVGLLTASDVEIIDCRRQPDGEVAP